MLFLFENQPFLHIFAKTKLIHFFNILNTYYNDSQYFPIYNLKRHRLFGGFFINLRQQGIKAFSL